MTYEGARNNTAPTRQHHRSRIVAGFGEPIGLSLSLVFGQYGDGHIVRRLTVRVGCFSVAIQLAAVPLFLWIGKQT